MSEIEVMAAHIAGAGSYLEVFGPCDPGVEPGVHVKKVYRRLARKVHPDKYTTAEEKNTAQEAFKLLGAFFTSAKKAVARGNYGVVPKVVVKTRKTEYEVGNLIQTGEVADLYQAIGKGTSDDWVMKIARVPIDNDLLASEAKSLRDLTGPDSDPDFSVFYPKLLDSFVYRDENAVQRRANMLSSLDGWYNLEEIRTAYPSGVSPLDMIWIWRRLLWLLGHSHDLGILHGAVLPSHIMVLPDQHGVMLVDWCYSQRADSTDLFQPMTAVSGRYLDWYPKEVKDKLKPSRGTDIYLAVRSMIYLLGGSSLNDLEKTPRAIRAFFRGCMQDNHLARPQEAWALLAEFDDLLEELGQPYFPRRFHPFEIK